MEFEFDNQISPQSAIDIDDIGSFALEAYNDEGLYYYLMVKSVLGICLVASCGPLVPDVKVLPSGFSIQTYQTPFSEHKLIKTIDLFLNDKYKLITNAQEIDMEDAIEQFRDVKDHLRTFDSGDL